MRWIPSVLLVSSLVACGGGGAPSPQAPSNGAGAGYVIWSRAERGEATSVWLDADGTVRGKAAGQYVVHGGRLARIDPRTEALQLTGCEGIDGEAPQPSKGSAVQLVLADVAGGGELDLNAPPTDEDGEGMGELDHGASVIGGLGRFLIIDEGASTYGCGAHGNGEASAHLFDLALGTTVPMSYGDGVVARLGRGAVAHFNTFEQLEGVEQVNLGESVFVWRDGKLALRHLLWVDACYACGSGDWASYTASEWFDDDQVPAPFDAEAAAVPAAVGRALTAASAGATAEEPVTTGVSWGTPDDSWAATFRP